MKSKTHIFMANLLIKELEGGELILPGIGSFAPPEIVKNAILNYPSAFRAGSVGPDFYPDAILGQTIIHTSESGKWIDLMFNRLRYSISEDFEKNFSFTLGYMFHYAGDMFGHSYVNKYAGGWFPPIKEIIYETEKAKMVARHLLVESYMDQRVPKDADMNLDAPIEFLRDVFYCNEAIDTHPHISKNSDYAFLKYREEVHNALRNTAVGLIPLVTDYVQHWEEDVDRGIIAWMDTWNRCAHLFSSNNSDKVKLAKGFLENWVIINGISMLGVPDFVSKVVKFIDQLNILEPLKNLIMDMFKDYLINIVNVITGNRYEKIEEAIEAFKNIFEDPKTYLNNGRLFDDTNITARLDEDFGNYGIETDTTKQSFHAVYQCLNMGKMILIGSDHVNKIIRDTGIQELYTTTNTVPAVKICSIKVKTGACKKAGSDNNIYIGLKYHGYIYEVLCDRPGYNDFEWNAIDEYKFFIPENIDLTAIEAISARMSGETGYGEWYCDWIEIKDKNRILIKSSKSFWLNTGNTHLSNYSRIVEIPAIRSIPIDPKIISFLYSLDGKDKHSVNPPMNEQWDIVAPYDFPFYSKLELRETVFKKLFVDKAQI